MTITLLSGCNKTSQVEDSTHTTAKSVIIVGAGIAGITAAKDLQEA